jgi:hypothetical protein
MKVNKKSKDLSLEDLKDWFTRDMEDASSLTELHILLNKITDTLNRDPVRINASAPYKQLKSDVKHQIKRLSEIKQDYSSRLLQAGANLTT